MKDQLHLVDNRACNTLIGNIIINTERSDVMNKSIKQLSAVFKISYVPSIAIIEVNLVKRIYAGFGEGRRSFIDFFAICLLSVISDLLAMSNW
jgi:hypothetical protein